MNKFACLTYHAIGEWGDQYTLSAKVFDDQLALLQGEDYVIDSFEGLELKLRSGQGVPSRYVLLTVDDGRESSLWVADLLGKRECQASFFLVRDRSLSKAGYIREKDIRELRRRGLSVGTHGTTHRNLTFLSDEQCLAELSESRVWLEDVIGEEVRYMATPGGFFNARVMRLACQCGYRLVGTCNEWMNFPSSMNLPGSVNRVNIRRHLSIHAFRQIVEGHPVSYMCRKARSALLWLPKQVLCR